MLIRYSKNRLFHITYPKSNRTQLNDFLRHYGRLLISCYVCRTIAFSYHYLEPQNMKWVDETRFSKETTSDGSTNNNRPSSRILYVRDMLLNRTPKEYMKYEQSDWAL